MKTLNSITFSTILLFFILLAHQGQAQSDYILNRDGSKVMGEVKNYNLKQVKFVPAGEKKAKKYNTEQVNELYKAGHGTFRALSLKEDKKRVFLHVLEDGKIKLYEFLVKGYVQGAPMYNGLGFSNMGAGYSYKNQRWYAQKEGSKLVDVKSNGIWGSRKDRKDAFSNLIADNPQVTKRYLEKDKFTFDFVMSLVVEYNKKAAE